MSVQVCPKCGAKNRIDERVVSRMRPVCGKCGAGLEANGQDARGATSDVNAASSGAGKTLTVTDDTLESEVLRASAGRPVLLDCWAPW
ncbi:MAG: hypothetical protein WCD76_19465, partial [Pyrinomonadaceae bacterium]